MSEELTAGQRVARAVKAGGTEADAEAHGAKYPQVKLGRVIEERAPEVFERLAAGEIGVTKAYRLANEGAKQGSHPAAAIFPMMGPEDRASLKASLERSGYREGEPPVLLHADGRVIDGRNRASVCDELGIDYPAEVYEGPEEEILPLVISRNLARRQLSDTQREMVAGKIAKELSKSTESAIRSTAATERWAREREIAEIRNNPHLDYDAKTLAITRLERQWAEAARQKNLAIARKVYIAVSGDKMKVGVSSNPEWRINDLRVADPGISLQETWPGGFAEERVIHALLAPFARGGEWFEFSEQTLGLVRDTMQKGHLAPLHTSANETAAKIMGVSARNVKRARQVLDSGDKKLVADVESGKVKVSQAARLLGPTPRKKPTPIAPTAAAKSSRPETKEPRRERAPSPPPADPLAPFEPRTRLENLALQFSNLINAIDDIAREVSATELLAGFPVQYVKNLDISLDSAAAFLSALAGLRSAGGANENTADGTAVSRNESLH